MDSMQNEEMSPFAQKVQNGLAKANRRMMEFDAALGRSLIIGQMDGGFKEIPAQQILSESQKLPWWEIHFHET